MLYESCIIIIIKINNNLFVKIHWYFKMKYIGVWNTPEEELMAVFRMNRYLMEILSMDLFIYKAAHTYCLRMTEVLLQAN